MRTRDQLPMVTGQPPRARSPHPVWLCYLAVVLGLAGIAPHAVDALTNLVKALRGPVAVAAQPEKAGDRKDESGTGEKGEGVGVHASDDAAANVRRPENLTRGSDPP